MSSKENEIKIEPDIDVEDLVQLYPQAVPLLAEKGLICVRCGEAVWGTLRELAHSKNIPNLDEILREINYLINDQKEMIV
jgi:hypothetical protein